MSPPRSRTAPPSLTAVQLLAAGEITARLLCGNPIATSATTRGEIALLPAGQIAAYSVRSGHLAGFFIFRTGVRGRLSQVPGVGGSVLLFLATGRRATAARTRNFLRKLSRYGHDPSSLSDDFWTRAAGALAARARPTRQLLHFLLENEAAPPGASVGARDGGVDHRRERDRGIAAHPELHAKPASRRVLAEAGAPRDQG